MCAQRPHSFLYGLTHRRISSQSTDFPPAITQKLAINGSADPAADQAGRGDMAVIGIHGIQCPVDSGNQFVQRIYQFLIAPGTFPQTDQKFSGCLPRPFMPRPHTAPADQNAEQAPGGIPFPPKERTQP